MREKYTGSPNKKNKSFKNMEPGEDDEEMLLETITRLVKDQPIETKSEKFTQINYALIAYYKTSRWMRRI